MMSGISTLNRLLLTLALLVTASETSEKPTASRLLQTDEVINLLLNPNADAYMRHWQAWGDAAIEKSDDGNRYFVVRNKGHFSQDVLLPEDAAGKYVVLTGRASSERVNPDGTITGLPYLYGYMLDDSSSRGGRILAYLQGQKMLCSCEEENRAAGLWGVFQVPEEARKLRFFLNQAERRGLPQSGSAARFDDLGLYLFETRQEAESFVKKYIQDDQ